MKIKWDDNAPYEFLMRFGVRHAEKGRMKDAVGAIRRLRFTEVDIDQVYIREPPYKIFVNGIKYYAKRLKEGKSIGTFYARHLENGKWQFKDGNHRFYVLASHEVKKFRVAYDPEEAI